MRPLFLLFLVLPFLATAQAPYPVQLQKELKTYKKAKIKTVKSYIKNGDEEKFLYSTHSYNKKGELTQIETWEEGTYIWNLSYNKTSLLEKETMLDAGENLLDETIYKYDKKNRLIEMNFKSEDYSFSALYKYDKKGRIDSSLTTGGEPRKTAWSYDHKDRIQSKIGFAIYNIDEPNNWEIADKELFEYDVAGNLVKSTACYEGMGCTALKYIYNKQNKCIQIDTKIDDESSSTYYEYNKQGFLSKEFTPLKEDNQGENSNKVTTYQYEYQ